MSYKCHKCGKLHTDLDSAGYCCYTPLLKDAPCMELSKLAYLSDVQDLILSNATSSNEKLKLHARTLLGPRTHGSTTRRGIMDGFGYSSLHHIHSAAVKPPCYAFGFNDDTALGGQLGAVSLAQARMMGLDIQERDGIHGRELFGTSRIAAKVNMPSTTEFTIIVGEFEGELAVFTWHPGPPLAPGVDMNNPMTAVKLV